MDDTNLISQFLQQYPFVALIILLLPFISTKVRAFFSTLVPMEVRRAHYKKDLIKTLLAAKIIDVTINTDEAIKKVDYIAEKLAECAFDDKS